MSYYEEGHYYFFIKEKAKMEEKKKERENWVSTKEICEYLGVKRHTVFAWVKELEMPGRKIGGNWKFKISEIEKWIEEKQEK